MSRDSQTGMGMRRFWDERAREDAYYFVDNRLRYGDPDLERFWADGERDLGRLLELAGMEVRSGESIVEIGCGVGRLSRALASRGAEVWAIDVSAEMLELAREHHGDIEEIHWILGDGASLTGVEDASMDGCVSHVVFQHIPDGGVIMSYVREIGRVLKPGGWAAFQVSNDPAVHRRPTLGARARLVAKLRRGPRGQDDPRWLGVAVDLDELRAVAAESGLTLERVSGEGTQFCVVGAQRTGER
jgi:SAM-dependent methyltransferase